MLSFTAAEEKYLMIGEQFKCFMNSFTDLVLKRAVCLVFHSFHCSEDYRVIYMVCAYFEGLQCQFVWL